MKNDRSQAKVPRYAISATELNRLLGRFAPDSPTRDELRNLILTMQADLHRGLPLLARASITERRARLDHLKSLEKALGASAKVLNERTASKRTTVGGLLGAEIALSLTDDAFRLARIAVAPSSRDIEMILARSRDPGAEIAAEVRRLREAHAARSPEVLANLLQRCRELVLAQLAVEGPAKPGRPSQPEREYVLSSLASRFVDLFNVVPTPTVTGKFVQLSIAVLGLLGLETLGVEAAAKRAIARTRQALASRS